MKKYAELQIRRMVDSLNKQITIQHAALGMVADDNYCDFFVENGGDGKPFHEKCPTSDLSGIEFSTSQFSAGRMSAVQKIADPDGGYCDFFVENGGDGKPFHEKCPSSNRNELVSNSAARNLAMGRLQVIQAFQRAELGAVSHGAD